MKIALSTFTLALIIVSSFAVDSVRAGDQENIQGTWTLETVSLDGKTMPLAAVQYIFKGDTLIVHPEAGKEQTTTFTLDLTSAPKVLVVQHDQDSSDAKPDRTPYELKGDTLKIAVTSPDERPTDVSDKGHVLFILKRKK